MTSFTDISLKSRSDLHILRKLWHISTGMLGFYIYWEFDVSVTTCAAIVLVIGILSLIGEFLRFRFKGFNELVCGVMGPLMRKCEKNGFSGMPFYALGVATSLFLFPIPIAIMSCLFLIFSDPLSSFIGVLYGKKKILPGKSWAGSITGFVCCLMISTFYLMYHLDLSGLSLLTSPSIIGFVFIAGIIGSLSELISAFGIDDNLSIPVLSGLGMTLLNFVIPVL